MYFARKEDFFDAAVNNSWTILYYILKFSNDICAIKMYLVKQIYICQILNHL